MPIIQSSKELRQIDGKPALNGNEGGTKVMTIGDAVAHVLSGSVKATERFGGLKAWTLAQKFYGAKTTEIDEADWASLKEFLDRDDSYPPIILGQIVAEFQEAKESELRAARVAAETMAQAAKKEPEIPKA